MDFEIEKHPSTSFIATAFKGSNGLLLNIPKDVVAYLEIERGDKVEITIRKTGLKSTRKHAFQGKATTPDGTI